MRKDATPLAKIPGLLDALLQVVCATNLVLNFMKMFIEDFFGPRMLLKLLPF